MERVFSQKQNVRQKQGKRREIDVDNKFLVTSSPHLFGNTTTRRIMLDVIIALIPAAIAGVCLFGFRVLLIYVSSVSASVIAEKVARIIMKKEDTIGDLSAVVTGLLLALNLPPSIEIWKAVIGAAFAIIVVKQLFGGIGHNFMNPALTARVVLVTSWGGAMTTWTTPLSWTAASSLSSASNAVASGAANAVASGTANAVASGAANAASSVTDAISSATPMALSKAAFLTGLVPAELPSYLDMFLGKIAGCIGETSALALLIGGVYLLARRVISWETPVAYIGAVAIASWILGGNNGIMTGDPLFHVLGGGLLLGAIFMATDYSTSPVTKVGKILMGLGCGILTVVIRLYAGYPEGVSFSILIMNVATPLIDRFTVPKSFGTTKSV